MFCKTWSHLFIFVCVVLHGTLQCSKAFVVPHLSHRIRAPTDLKVSIKLAVSDKDSTDALLKKLKRCCNQTGHLRELRFKDHWESAAEKKKRKSAQARIRRRFERANERFLKLARGDSEYDT